MKLTAEQRIERAHVRLMQSPSFCLFSGVFMVGKVTVIDKPITARTNGRDVEYGRTFVDNLSDKELAFVVVHEAMHKSYRHLTVWSHLPNRRVANYAMDYVINLQICDTDYSEKEVSMPRDRATGQLIGLLDEKYRGMDTKQVYDLLIEESEDGDDGDEDGDGDGDGGSGGDGGDGQADRPSECLDEHDWEGAKNLSQEEKEELDREIDSALREGAILAGKMNGDVPRGIDEILHPKIDWREALRDFIKMATKGGDESTWRRPNRRYLGNDIIMPSAQTLKAECFAVGIDVSGSTHSIMPRFMGELASICSEIPPEKLELMYWDSSVERHETYSGGEMETLLSTTRPVGGGGTDPDCVAHYMREKQMTPQCLIMLTDGYFFSHRADSWAPINVPILWCVVGNSSFEPTVGQVVSME